jgi:tetratricopeptide (TPR) repeat protein
MHIRKVFIFFILLTLLVMGFSACRGKSENGLAGDQETDQGGETLPPAWTPTPPIMPTSIAETPTLPAEELVALIQPDLESGLRASSKGDCITAIDHYGIVLELDPTNQEALGQRALCYMYLARRTVIREAGVDYTLAAIQDLDKYAEIAEPINIGNVHVMRAMAYSLLATFQEYRSHRQQYIEIAFENGAIASQYYNAYPFLYTWPSSFRVRAGNCQSAANDATNWINLRGSGSAPNLTLHQTLADAYLCLGEYEKALENYEIVLSKSQAQSSKYRYALSLYLLGRDSEALSALDEMIAEQSAYSGERYYLRALIHWNRGEVEQAVQNLNAGKNNTWQRGGIRAYVESQIAFMDGNEQLGIEFLQLAEASIDPHDGLYFNEAWLQELGQHGALPLIPPDSPLQATPIAPNPDLEGRPDLQPIEMIGNFMGENLGSFTMDPHGRFEVHDIPSDSHRIDRYLEIVFHVVPADPEQTQTPIIQVLRDEEMFRWGTFQVQWGDNPIPDANQYATFNGDVIYRVVNPYDTPLPIKDILVKTAIQSGSEVVVYGVEE